MTDRPLQNEALERGRAPAYPSKSPAQLGFLLPSAADLIFVLLTLGLSYGVMTSRLLGDGGIGWHIRNGEQMLATHTITRVDPFSSSMAGKPWYAWEWLYELVIAGIHRWAGLNGVAFFTAVVIALTFGLVLRMAVRRGTQLPLAVILLVLSVGASAIHFFARPHTLSWLLTVVWFWILDSTEVDGNLRRFLWLPPLMLLWANLHGGFLLGFVLLGIYFAGSLIRYLASHEPAEREAALSLSKAFAGVTLLCGLASLVNPYGYRLHVHICQYLSDRFLMDHIDEFLSPNFHGLPQRCFALLLLIALLALAATPRKPGPVPLLILLFAAYSGLYAARNIPVSSILLMLVSGPLLSQTIVHAAGSVNIPPGVRGFFAWLRNYGDRMGAMDVRRSISLWPVAIVVLGGWVCLHGGQLGTLPLMQAHFDDKRFPVMAVDHLQPGDLREPVFALDYWGGYLIYRLYPQTRFVVDDRHDFYGVQFLKDYLKLIRIEPQWDSVLEKWHINTVLIPKGSPLANVLAETPEWKLQYEDKTTVFFERK